MTDTFRDPLRPGPVRRIIILGAGFSVPAGLPDASRLWTLLLERAKETPNLYAQVEHDLADYRGYLMQTEGRFMELADVDFEEFLAFLEVEHFLGLRGSDTWSDSGNETQVILKRLIGEILLAHTPAVDAVPSLYLEFARRLRPGDFVLTFNYDVVLERALAAIGKEFRLAPLTIGGAGAGIEPLGMESDTVTLLKLHGSVDWFDRRVLDRAGIWESNGDAPFGLQPIVEPSVASHHGLSSISRATEVDRIYTQKPGLQLVPFLLPPSSMKAMSLGPLRELFFGMGRAGALSFGVAVVGYSMPQHDNYLRQVLYRIIVNYQDFQWDTELLGQTKRPLGIIDLQPDFEKRQEFQARWSFVDWGKTSFDSQGFSERSLDTIFPE